MFNNFNSLTGVGLTIMIGGFAILAIAGFFMNYPVETAFALLLGTIVIIIYKKRINNKRPNKIRL